jgi:arginyl-tRNA synthetase
MSEAPLTAPQAIASILEQSVRSLLPQDAELPKLGVDRSKAGFSSDFQSAAAMQLAKILRRAPRDIAEQLVDAVRERAGSLLDEPDISGPGFVGFRLSEQAMAGYLKTLLAAHRLGVAQSEGTIVVDFSSPNVAKRMHIGHIRSTVIGDALRRMGLFLGYRVIGDNHIGDWGTQFGQLIYAWDHWLDRAAYDADPVGELERLYVKFNQDAQEDPDLMDLARAELVKLQAGDERNLALWTQFRNDSAAAFDAVYERLGVHFDVTFGESHYNDMLGPLVDDLISSGIAEHSEGAVCVFFRDEQGEDVLPPFLVQKADGAALYATTDLATVVYRMKEWRPDRILYVTDHRQKLHFEQVFATCDKMGIDTTFVHVPFGIMSLPEGSISTRSGNTIRLDELLDEAERRARATQEERIAGGGEPMSETELDSLAEMIGIGAVKYADLSNNPASNILFSFEKMLSFEGNTAPYLQYTSARTHSLLRKAALAGHSPDGKTLQLQDPVERELMLHLMEFGAAVRSGFDSGRPSTLATYLHELASNYHRWYAACPVLKLEDVSLIASRLNLSLLTQKTLTQGLALLGIGAPERM